MLFLWTVTKRGKIWLDGEAFRQIIVKRLPQNFSCQEVSFIGEQNLLNIYITLPDKDDPQKRLALVDKFENFFKPLGISTHIHWTRKAPEESWEDAPHWKKPLFWAAVVGGLTGLVNLGLKGSLLVVLATFLGYTVSWFVFAEDGRRIIGKFISDIKDLRR